MADINLFSPAERTHRFANAWTVQGVFTVAGHGNPQIMLNQSQAIRATDLAAMIKADSKFKGQAVMLGSCNTGNNAPNGDPAFAQQLANSLGVPVIAPLGFAWFCPSGLLGSPGPSSPPVAGNPGAWRTFFPGGR